MKKYLCLENHATHFFMQTFGVHFISYATFFSAISSFI